MEQWLGVSAGYVGFALEAMAVLIIAVGSIKVFIAGLGAMLFKPSLHDAIREVWLDYARYLIAGLTRHFRELVPVPPGDRGDRRESDPTGPPARFRVAQSRSICDS